MKPEASAGFAPDKPILVLHGSGDKASTFTDTTAMIREPDCPIGHQPQRIQEVCRYPESQR